MKEDNILRYAVTHAESEKGCGAEKHRQRKLHPDVLFWWFEDILAGTLLRVKSAVVVDHLGSVAVFLLRCNFMSELGDRWL